MDKQSEVQVIWQLACVACGGVDGDVSSPPAQSEKSTLPNDVPQVIWQLACVACGGVDGEVTK